MQWRPPQTGDENLRKVWDAIYALQNGHTNLAASVATNTRSIQTVSAPPTVQQIIQQISSGGGGPYNLGPTFKTNSVPNSVQNLLNLIAGSNVTLTAAGGNVTIASSGGGGGSGPPWWNITNPTLVTYSWRNQGSATVNASGTFQSIFLSSPGSTNGFNGREISAPSAPVSITVGFIPLQHNVNFASCGIYVADSGTKAILELIVDQLSGTSNSLLVQSYTTFSTGSGASNLFTGGMGYFISPVFFKVVDDGTNLKWYWSPDGVNFIQTYSAARLAFLASISAFGFFSSAGSGADPSSVLVVSWTQGTS